LPEHKNETKKSNADKFVLFDKYKKTKRKIYREQIVAEYIDLVRFIARRFLYRGEPLDDLVQVGTIGLLKAIERFDSKFGTQFTTFATPTIIGEIKHYFRDESHTVKIPRRLEELGVQIKKVIQKHTQAKGMAPSPKEISKALGIDIDAITEAMDTFQNYTTVSLDSSISHSDKGEGDNNLLNTLVADEGVDQIVNSEHLKRAISFLTQREQKILHMTYFQHLQQWEISKKLNISQVHVSRLIGHALKRLKRILIREAKEDQVYSGE